jgi:spore coat polysaccharide biosynthesis protein SpsF
MSRTVAIIQARMGSTRLPGKVLLDLEGKPMLVRVVERVKRARLLNETIVATSTADQDSAIEQLCSERGYLVYRGSLKDVLGRYYKAARQVKADVIVRITGDCPGVDPNLIDAAIQARSESNADLTLNRLPPPWKRTYPIGLDVEVCTFTALKRAYKEADQDFQREHVMLYFYEGIPTHAFKMEGNSLAVSPRGFRVQLINHHPDLGSMRWTVDTPQDLELMRRVYKIFKGRDDFSWLEVLTIFQQNPALAEINAMVEHKTAFDVDNQVK